MLLLYTSDDAILHPGTTSCRCPFVALFQADLEASVDEAVSSGEDGSRRTVNVTIDAEVSSNNSTEVTRLRKRRRLQEVGPRSRVHVFCVFICVFVCPRCKRPHGVRFL